MSNKIGNLLILSQLLLALSFSVMAQPKAQLTKTRFSGQLKNLPKRLIKLNLEEDINRKISKTVAEIKG
ncbi:MAG: hypothetical protein HC846_05525 [Blastocatellia bacterium]|nr:hypothetical protein [Blastocatellia bacterium]